MAKLALYIRQGDTLRQSFLFQERENGVTTPLNLTGCTARIHVRPKVADDDKSSSPLLTFSTADGTILPLDNTGVVAIVFTDRSVTTGTGKKSLANAVFDIEITFANGDVKTYPPNDTGIVIFTPEVTR